MDGQMVFKPGVAEQAAETLSSILNGELQNSVINAWNICKNMGEDNPLVETLGTSLKDYEAKFNDELLPLATRLKDNFFANEEFVKRFNSLSVATVSKDVDLGTVQDNNYDAAAHL